MGLKYRVTVDGTAYTVEVDELGVAPVAPAPVSAPVVAAPAASVPASAPSAPAPSVSAPSAPAPAAPEASAPAVAGGTVVEAPMPGKVLSLNVAVGDVVGNGHLLMVLEAMKMENEIFAQAGGTVKEICVSAGDSVNTGDAMIIIG